MCVYIRMCLYEEICIYGYVFICRSWALHCLLCPVMKSLFLEKKLDFHFDSLSLSLSSYFCMFLLGSLVASSCHHPLLFWTHISFFLEYSLLECHLWSLGLGIYSIYEVNTSSPHHFTVFVIKKSFVVGAGKSISY